MDFKTNTGFNIANTSSHEDFDDDYILIYKDINNILDDIGFQGDDRILCKYIIENLEKEASINIRKDKCVAIPHIGTIQKNWYRSKLISHYKDFKEARKTMTREEYKEYTAKVMEEEKQKHYEEEEKITNDTELTRSITVGTFGQNQGYKKGQKVWFVEFKVIAINDLRAAITDKHNAVNPFVYHSAEKAN